MTPQEKAKELIDKYEEYAYTAFDEKVGFSMEMLLNNQKMCALICVDEIINGNFSEGYNHTYWLEVKEKINNF